MSKSIIHPLRCPKCESTESLHTIEAVEGTCDIIITDDGEWEFGGYTDWDYSGSTTRSLACYECDWSATPDNGQTDSQWITDMLRAG